MTVALGEDSRVAVLAEPDDGWRLSPRVGATRSVPVMDLRFGNTFPATDPVSRFLVSMAMARNDIEHAMWMAADANADDRPEFAYWVRLVMGHFVEAVDSLQRWRNHSPEIREFLGTLPPTGRSALDEVGKTLAKVGQKAVAHARNHTFHYPSPSGQYESDADLERILESVKDEEVRLAQIADRPGRLRYVFADEIALVLAMDRHTIEDNAAYRAQVRQLEEGAAHFVNFVGVAIGEHLGGPAEPTKSGG
jgi:hypothetical protein